MDPTYRLLLFSLVHQFIVRKGIHRILLYVYQAMLLSPILFRHVMFSIYMRNHYYDLHSYFYLFQTT